MTYLGEQVRELRKDDRSARRSRRTARVAPREYARLTAVYQPLVTAALEQPNPTPALRAAVEKIARELGL